MEGLSMLGEAITGINEGLSNIEGLQQAGPGFYPL